MNYGQVRYPTLVDKIPCQENGKMMKNNVKTSMTKLPLKKSNSDDCYKAILGPRYIARLAVKNN